MKSKTKKRILWGCGSVVSLILLIIVVICGIFFYMTRDNRIATDPEKIADEADFDLPAYTVISQDDNMDRPASAWSAYEWVLLLNEPLAEKDIKKLNKLVGKDTHWSYNEKSHTYIYRFEEEERYFSIEISINERKVYMDYNWWDILS